jgi:hypothetical protein
MSLKSVIKYQIADFKSAVIVFYLTVLLLIALFSVLFYEIADTSAVSISGTETATIFFLFVIGLNSFRETFKMTIQNGISRRTMFKGFLFTALIMSVGMSVINELFLLGGRIFISGRNNVSYISLFEQIYFLDRGDEASRNILQFTIGEILFVTFLSAAAMMLGYFITSLYYRLNKSGKIAVSIGVPAMLIIIIPVFDALVTKGLIYKAAGHLIMFAFGILNGYNPCYAMASCFIIFTLLASISYTMIKKAPVK